MKFCTSCGFKLNDDSKFCCSCGAKQPIRIVDTATTEATSVASTTSVTPPTSAEPVTPTAVPQNDRFAAMRVRYRCNNGHVFNGLGSTTVCPECQSPLQKGGYIQLYRMGNYMGMAVGMGVYIDDIPYGHIGNKESIRINLPYGPHKIHVTHTSTRKCNDPVYTISPATPVVYAKVHFAAGGFRIAVEEADEKEMPL